MVTKVFAESTDRVMGLLANNGLSILPSPRQPNTPAGPYDALVEKIRTGDIHVGDIPLFISYFIQTAIVFAGIVAFLMIIVGGYQYIIGGVYSDMREQGKTTLIYAISGFVLAMLAYAIVNLIQLAVTGI